MPEKAANLGWVLGPSSKIEWWFKLLTAGVFLGILIIWGIDGVNMKTLHKDFVAMKLVNVTLQQQRDHKVSIFRNLEPELETNPRRNLDPEPAHQNSSETHENPDTEFAPRPQPRNIVVSHFTPRVSRSSEKGPEVNPWISSELEPNYSSNLLSKWLAPGGEPCKDSRTVDIRLLDRSLDGAGSIDGERIELSTGEIHEFVFQALDSTGEPHCLGGDYFEIDLSGGKWKSRPPIKDMGNGTYKFTLQVHPDFSGEYNLTIILLYRNYEGLKFSPARFVFDKVLRVISLKFFKSSSKLMGLRQCEWSDYTRDVWSGRWTRHANNKSCPIGKDGRYRCQKRNFPCRAPWCQGPLGSLESNGWVYSAHCSFKLLSRREAWDCLAGRWIFWWGDSNHCDTIRNILHFILDVHDIPVVPRLFDRNITNPRNQAQTVRFTSIFNGHPNHTGNYRGLDSLSEENYRMMIEAYFRQDKVPDTVIMNSGLHDGVFWRNIRSFIKGADYAAEFWAGLMDRVRKNGLSRPEVIYRTTVATGGHARKLAFNPHKMEAFNGVVLDKLRKYGVVDRVVDGFDMTYAWHYDNRCNDGVHYGRAPLKMKWRDGEIGHQYFVDLMLGHVLINALCGRRNNLI